MSPPFDPLSVSSPEEAYAARMAGHDAERSAAIMEEMLVRGEKQLLECLSREGK